MDNDVNKLKDKFRELLDQAFGLDKELSQAFSRLDVREKLVDFRQRLNKKSAQSTQSMQDRL
jgi:hypothetical protein